MKTKTLLLIAVAAVVTLSFTFVASKKVTNTKEATNSQAPIGGFVSESSF